MQNHCSSNCMMWLHRSVKQTSLPSILSQFTDPPVLGTQVLLLFFSLIPYEVSKLLIMPQHVQNCFSDINSDLIA